MSESGRGAESAEWLRFAERDLRAIRALRADAVDHSETIVFWAQQVVEKSLKSMLAFQGSRTPRTHDLTVLARTVSAELAFLPHMDQLERLTRMAAGSRYPDMHISIDDRDASTAVEIAESAYEEIARLIREQETE